MTTAKVRTANMLSLKRRKTATMIGTQGCQQIPLGEKAGAGDLPPVDHLSHIKQFGGPDIKKLCLRTGQFIVTRRPVAARRPISETSNFNISWRHCYAARHAHERENPVEHWIFPETKDSSEEGELNSPQATLTPSHCSKKKISGQSFKDRSFTSRCPTKSYL